uniref:Zinc finger GRF-type domain-containing protein n=1 Tax=Lactuca sativa TaxID=4236 RepID=A0A9R1VG56_LACSA|nr:hypothetical protein LSAT_V11C500279430 [Lactuca sativa]
MARFPNKLEFQLMASSSSISSSRNPHLQITNFRHSSSSANMCGCDKPAKERTSLKYHNPGHQFWNCQNSLVVDFVNNFKDDELPEGCYKSLIRSLKEKLNMKEELVELVMLRTKVHEQEYLLSKEKEVVMNLDNEVLAEKEHVLNFHIPKIVSIFHTINTGVVIINFIMFFIKPPPPNSIPIMVNINRNYVMCVICIKNKSNIIYIIKKRSNVIT